MKGSGELRAFIDGFLGSVPGAFIVLDKEWRLVYLNSDALRLFTGNNESLIGRPLEEVYPRRFSHLISPQTIRGLLEGKENTDDRYSNDFRKWFRISAYSTDSGIFIRLEDITLEKAANRSRIINQFSVDRAGDMILWFKPNGHIIYANETSSKSLKFDRRELASMMVTDIDPSFTDNKWAAFVEDLRTRDSVVYESSLRASNRSFIQVEVSWNYMVYYGEEYLIASARDITERKRAEKALRESEEKYRVLVENVNDIVWQIDEKFVYTYISPQIYDAWGYTPEEVVGKTPMDFMPPDEAEQVSKSLEDVARKRDKLFMYENQHIRKDGRIMYMEVSGQPIIDENGVYRGYRGVARDITERKHTEVALQKSEASLARAQFLAHIGNWSWDLGTNELEYSDECYRLLGYKPGEIKPVPFDFFTSHIHPDDKGSFFNAIRESIQDVKPFSIDFRLVKPDGTIVYMHDDGEVQYDAWGKPVRMFGTVQDITEHKRAEEALRESEEKFRKFFDIPLIGAAITSPEKRFILVNDKLCEMFGYSREELLKTSWDKITSPEDMPRNLDAFKRLMSGEIDTYTFEKRFIHKNGSIVYVLLSVECIRREDGTVDYLISNYNDITKRKHAEIALQEAKNQAEIYLDLMGHDINNLNQIALGYLELANDQLKDDKVRELISKPVEVITSSSNLIENVRKLQKSRTHGLRIEAIDLNDVLSRLKTHYSKVPDKEVHIELTSSPNAFIMANGLINDVFSNLIINAIKHSNNAKPVNICIRLERVTGVKELIKVAIEDNGPGIPDEIKNKLFTRFQRGNTKATGKGLGLYLVKTLLDDFHGKVWAEDRVQGDYTRGSRFVVTLPAVEK
ncbi:putative histidine kinase [Methanocella paludicola SANAE]|uniref:histidine kinase n=2 Tax=Methanocella TaxID=570266 RepID=D1YY36_METPS|nr:putative histidine kinase [Methanocella paludicola SANAE]